PRTAKDRSTDTAGAACGDAAAPPLATWAQSFPAPPAQSASSTEIASRLADMRGQTPVLVLVEKGRLRRACLEAAAYADAELDIPAQCGKALRDIELRTPRGRLYAAGNLPANVAEGTPGAERTRELGLKCRTH